MNSQEIRDISLMYEAVYNEELRVKAEDYNNTVFDEDIVEVATEYFYTYGLNEDGIDILIEKVGLDNFVEFVCGLSEDLTVLTEARSARRRRGGESYEDVKAKIDAKEAAKKKAKKAAQERTETERKEPESKGADTEAKAEQPKSKKPQRGGIASRIGAALVDRAKRDTELLKKSWNTAREVGREHEGRVASAAGTVAGVAHGAAKVAHRLGQEAGRSETGQKIKKALGVAEEFEYWVNSLVEEGYDLSEYTWDDMYEIYLDEAARRTRRKKRGVVDPENEMAGRSDAGKRISGDEKTGPRYYALGRRVSPDAPTQPGEKPVNTPKLSQSEKDNIQYRKANLKAGKVHKVGGERGLPESYDYFDYILEHLVAEGYADTNQDALVIMANMDKDQIEEATSFYYKLQKAGKGGSKTAAAQLRTDADLRTQKSAKIGRQRARQRQERESDDDPRDHGSLSAAERNPSMR